MPRNYKRFYVENAFSQLCDLLTDEAERQETILSLLRAQGEAVRARDAVAVEDRTRAIELAARETAAGETLRQRALDRLFDYYELSGDQQTMSALVTLAPPRWRDRLKHVQQRIRTALEDSRREVRINARLIRQAQRTVDACLELIAAAETPARGYAATGAAAARGEAIPALIDTKG